MYLYFRFPWNPILFIKVQGKAYNGKQKKRSIPVTRIIINNVIWHVIASLLTQMHIHRQWEVTTESIQEVWQLWS